MRLRPSTDRSAGTSAAIGLCALALLSFPACGGSSGSSPTAPTPTATVQFTYAAATAVDPNVAARFPGCVAGVGQTHIHPGWRGFARVNMVADGANLWRSGFADVPIGSEQRIRISDPNTCATEPNGSTIVNVSANGVLLTRAVETPDHGPVSGLAFAVDAAGTVTP